PMAAPVAAPSQGFMVFDPTTGQYVQKQLDTMAAATPPAVPQMVQAPAPTAQPAPAQLQNVLVLDPTTGQYVQK
ncbi:MAG: hypothetical protein RR816_06410, partial [Clostridia bacterium]